MSRQHMDAQLSNKLQSKLQKHKILQAYYTITSGSIIKVGYCYTQTYKQNDQEQHIYDAPHDMKRKNKR